MSLARYLFGDFQVVFRTLLPVSVATGKLVSRSDQSTFHTDKAQLRGYTTINEAVLWEGGNFIFNPFRPYFHGSFTQEQGLAVLSGTIRAHWIIKLWCTCATIAGLLDLAFSSSDGFARPLGTLAVGAASLFLLHLTIRPASKSVKSLQTKIEATIGGAEANNSFKPTPFIGAA